SLDCVSIFSLNIDDAELIASLMEGFDLADGYSRTAPAPATQFPAKPRFAIPASPNWFGDEQAQAAWEIALEKMRALDVELVELDFTPMFALAQLLYGGAWVAERHAAIGDFMKDHADEMNEVVRSIVEKAANFSASDTFKAEYQRAQFAQQIQILISRFDALL